MSTRYRRNPDLLLEWGDGHDSLVVLDPRTLRRFTVQRTALELLNQMSTPVRGDELVTGEDAARTHDVLLERMSTAGIVETVDGTDDAPNGMAWTAAELAVHAQCARGGIVDSEQHRDEMPSARLRHPEASERIPLPSRDETGSQPLAEVLRERRSVRDFADTPVDLDTLARFLDVSARVRGWLGPDHAQATRRPSASGGGRHSVELYAVLRDVAGVVPGAYHYDPFDHCLERLAPWGPELADLQQRLVCAPTLAADPPPVSFYLVSCFRRVQWKYGGMTLGIIYRDTGCLLQTMYLVAADLGLGGCATAALEAEIGPEFLRGYRDQLLHVGNFALGRPAATERPRGTYRPLRRDERI